MENGVREIVTPLLQRAISLFNKTYGFVKKLNKNLDVAGLLMMYYMLGIIVLGPFYPIIVFLLNLDPYHFLFPRVFSQKYEQSIGLILLIRFLRLFLTFIIYIELVRFLTLVLFITIISSQGMLLLLKSLDTGKYPQNFILRYYIHLRILFISSKDFIGTIIFQLIGFSQVILCMMAWITINCWGLVPPFLTAILAAAFVGGVGITQFLLREGANVRVESQRVLRRNLMFCKRKSLRELICKWKAQEVLPVNCGSHFAVDRDAIMNYFLVLNTNITNALLLINP
ncbi:unnamed protein product [Orchesella dallaii]|uniref:Uncharacterized protein n=1 Tax=Orchesella dallaii TaxID=48710 RepID=A0ABP1S7L7_9HEXA